MIQEKNEQELQKDYIKVARKWQELLIREMERYDINKTRVITESGMGDDVFEHFCDGIAQPIKILQLKNAIKHILKERDLNECKDVGKHKVRFPKTAEYLDDIKLMDLYMPLDEEEDFIKASSSLDNGQKLKNAIKSMKAIMEQEHVPPIEIKVGKRKNEETIRKLTNGEEE